MADEHAIADPTYHRTLGDGLRVRWSSAADAHAIAHIQSVVYRPSADAPLHSPSILDRVQRQMRGNYLMGPTDYAVVEDTTREGRPIVACACLWQHTWEYAGIPFGVGRPEYVAVDPAYRRRGLVREIFTLLHARSAVRGDLMQAITGISYFYRQFGYEYALDLEGARGVPLSLIPTRQTGAEESYLLRPATADDRERLLTLQNTRRQAMLVWDVKPADFWSYHLIEMADDQIPSKRRAFQMIVDRSGGVVGYVYAGTKRRNQYLMVYACELDPQVNLWETLPPLLRALEQHARSIPAIDTVEPLRAIKFQLGREHPLYDALGAELAPIYEQPYAWYIRIADPWRFLAHVAPVLEQRLRGSLFAEYSGELKVDWYRDGLRLDITAGKITTLERWQAPAYGDEAQAGCPALVFLQALLGYRSFAELRTIYPDVWATHQALELLQVLFPKQPSLVWDD
jgi:GNAT superfamily N-acetyltransferase